MNSYYRAITDIKEKYDIDIAFGDDRREKEISYNEVNATRARNYVESFLHQELLIYSPETLRKSKLQRIVICENISTCRGKANGAAEMKKLILPGRKNTIYLDITTEHDNLHRATVHHEIFHAIDYSNRNWGGYDDYEWEKLNPPSFEYGSVKWWKSYDYESPGFVNGYATSAVQEDKAECFAHMMVDYAGTEERASTDQFLDNKMKRLKLLLKNFNPQFNDDFWEKRRPLSGPVFWL